nr:L758 [uncultured bacterium]
MTHPSDLRIVQAVMLAGVALRGHPFLFHLEKDSATTHANHNVSFVVSFY